jgi:predicted nucleic acid-binding protein
MLVLDASVTIAAMLQEARSTRARDILRLVAQEGARVPSLWRLEVGNDLLLAVRRRKLLDDERMTCLEDLAELPIIDQETAGQAWRTTMELAARHRLTLYDAAYLELAHRRSLPLPTFDDPAGPRSGSRRGCHGLSQPSRSLPYLFFQSGFRFSANAFGPSI